MDYPQSTRDITAFLLRRLPHLRASSVKDVLAWVQWHCNRGLTLVVRDGSRIAGVCLLRRVNSREEAEAMYDHKDNGFVAYIDAAAALPGVGFRPLFNLFLLTHGRHCTHMAWNRIKYGSRVTILPIRDAFRLMAA